MSFFAWLFSLRLNTSAHAQYGEWRAVRRDSGEFARFWEQHGVVEREGGSRTFDHPTDGFLRYVQVTFDLAGRPDLKMTMLVQGSIAAGDADATSASRLPRS